MSAGCLAFFWSDGRVKLLITHSATVRLNSGLSNNRHVCQRTRIGGVRTSLPRLYCLHIMADGELSLKPLTLRPGGAAKNPFASFGKGAGFGMNKKVSHTCKRAVCAPSDLQCLCLSV